MTFWAPWHPGIGAIDVWDRTVGRVNEDELIDAELRHHCYELPIGTQHFAWCAWTGNADELGNVANRTAEVLARGPQRC